MSLAPSTVGELLGVLVDRAVWGSVHTGPPGETGQWEIPSAKRQRLVWSQPAAGQMHLRQRVLWMIPRRTTVTHVGYWDDKGGFVGGRELQEPAEFGEAGSLSLFPGDLVELLLDVA